MLDSFGITRFVRNNVTSEFGITIFDSLGFNSYLRCDTKKENGFLCNIFSKVSKKYPFVHFRAQLKKILSFWLAEMRRH